MRVRSVIVGGERNRLGVMVDISHVSDKAFYDVLEITRAPAEHGSPDRDLIQVPVYDLACERVV